MPNERRERRNEREGERGRGAIIQRDKRIHARLAGVSRITSGPGFLPRRLPSEIKFKAAFRF